MVIFCSFFFFSSRRRHTRWPRDWSSDVCSSDLVRARTSGRLRCLGRGRGDRLELRRDRKSVVWGKSVDLGGRRIIKKKKKKKKKKKEKRREYTRKKTNKKQ